MTEQNKTAQELEDIFNRSPCLTRKSVNGYPLVATRRFSRTSQGSVLLG
ncbi:MAG: hypothetical protein IJ883_00375 [Eubacterium sp.]|nr:hypothetical protein [Eubacterium sp.]